MALRLSAVLVNLFGGKFAYRSYSQSERGRGAKIKLTAFGAQHGKSTCTACPNASDVSEWWCRVYVPVGKASNAHTPTHAGNKFRREEKSAASRWGTR